MASRARPQTHPSEDSVAKNHKRKHQQAAAEVIGQATTTEKITCRGSGEDRPPCPLAIDHRGACQQTMSNDNTGDTGGGFSILSTPHKHPIWLCASSCFIRTRCHESKGGSKKEDECTALLNENKRILGLAPADQSIMRLKEEEKRLEAELSSVMEESARASQSYPQRMTMQMNSIRRSYDRRQTMPTR